MSYDIIRSQKENIFVDLVKVRRNVYVSVHLRFKVLFNLFLLVR